MSTQQPRRQGEAHHGPSGRSRNRVGSVVGALLALVPTLASAQESGGRTLEPSDDFGAVVFVTALTAGGILLLASLGRMYQRQRNIRWRFQDPDAPHDEHH